MFRRIVMAAGVSLTQMAVMLGMSKQSLNSKLSSKNIALLFALLEACEAKLVVEYKDGTRLDLMQYSKEFEFVQRPDLKKSCKDA